jgi:hypothetical protein
VENFDANYCQRCPSSTNDVQVLQKEEEKGGGMKGN